MDELREELARLRLELDIATKQRDLALKCVDSERELGLARLLLAEHNVEQLRAELEQLRPELAQAKAKLERRYAKN